MNILSELKLRNISINECSNRTGIPYGSLYPLVHGKKQLEKCEYITLKKLADFFLCTVDDLLTSTQDFSVFWADEITADVKITENKVFIKRYTLHPAKQIFSKDELPLFELNDILRWRCWDNKRENIEKYLYKIGLTDFNPFKICKKTHAVMPQDKIWIKFAGENISWKDVRWK